MIDISEQLYAAKTAAHSEDDRPAGRVAAALQAELSWEPCENWASVVGSRVLAHVHVLSPLAICLTPLRDAVTTVLGPKAIVVTVDDMDGVELSASVESLQALFDTDFTDSWEFDPSRFAASDLWFMTVT